MNTLRLNLYLWCTKTYLSFAEAVSKGDYVLVGRYIELGSTEYDKVKFAIEETLDTMCQGYLKIEEVNFIEGETLGM